MNLPSKTWTRGMICVLLCAAPILWACKGEGEAKKDDFHTSGSREADQRAEQVMARERQIRGEDADAEEQEAHNRTLYDRLGGEQGVRSIVDDFVARAMADPRVNWRRRGVTYGGFLKFRDKSAEWQATARDVEQLKKHLAQFIAVAAGGPSRYQGANIAAVHQDMRITNAEFDAAIGDMKATLDALGIGTEEQKELLAVLESTRPQVVTVK
jgi:hemoglobin